MHFHLNVSIKLHTPLKFFDTLLHGDILFEWIPESTSKINERMQNMPFPSKWHTFYITVDTSLLG